MSVLSRLSLSASLIALVACEPPEVSAAKTVCACFDIANYKIGKGHKEGGQNYERCRKELEGYLGRYAKDEKRRNDFLNALKKCPNATIAPPPKK